MPIKTDDRIEREVKAAHGLRFKHIEWTTAYGRITDTTTLIIIDSSEVVPRKCKYLNSVDNYLLHLPAFHIF